MTLRSLVFSSLRFHWRTHLGVLLASFVGASVLIGALLVGDSVRLSLREMGLQRLLGYAFALDSGDRFYRGNLFDSLSRDASPLAPGPGSSATNGMSGGVFDSLIRLSATASRQNPAARANHIQVFGLGAAGPNNPGASADGRPGPFLASLRTGEGTVVINEALAAQLQAQPGDEIVLRLHKPSALSRDAVISPQEEQSVALRVKVRSIASAREGGNLGLRSGQSPPLNAFVAMSELAPLVGLAGRVNLTLMAPSHGGDSPAPGVQALQLQRALDSMWDLADAELELRRTPGGQPDIELISRRIFLEDPVVTAATASSGTNRHFAGTGLLTYLVNQVRAGDRSTPYSMVTGAGAPWVPADLGDDEIVINQWLAEDLQLVPGGGLELSYYLLDTGTQLVERSHRFRVRSVVPIEGVHADRTLMPEFPGLSKAESTRDWDAGFKLVHPIRDRDEAYWKKHRGTPKAFISLRTAQKLWANRFGGLTAIRFPVPPGTSPADVEASVRASLRSNLTPAQVGLQVVSVREQALKAADEGQDFGQLFLGFSFFLIAAALVLMSLLFQFGVEQRQSELGLLLALGYPPSRVRRLLLGEALVLAALGGAAGAAGAAGYASAMVWALGTLWRDAVGTQSLSFHMVPQTLAGGWMASVLVAGGTIAWVLRRQARRPARELLNPGSGDDLSTGGAAGVAGGSVARWIAWLCGAGALGLTGWAIASGQSSNAPLFFGASSLALMAGLAMLAVWLRRLSSGRDDAALTFGGLSRRGLGRRRSRSLAASASLACGSFLVVAIGVNRLDATKDATRRGAGTGGFVAIAESTLPLTRSLNTSAGREALGLDATVMKDVSVVPFRVRPGDDASCLNLNRAQNPRLLGVDPRLLKERSAFTFAGVAAGFSASEGWGLIARDGVQPGAGDPIPAIGDAASIQWALGRKLGDVLTFRDERGAEFQIRLVAGLANSILQGSLVIDEREFVRKFPGIAGHQFQLIDAPTAGLPGLSTELTRGLQDYGMQITPAMDRLNSFNAVQNTYLSTFQLLGGLGLVLGSLGLGVVLLRNALERRGELALLQAVGYPLGRLHGLLFREHALLLLAGLGVGVGAAVLGVLPVALASSQPVPVALLSGLLGLVLFLGFMSTWLATRSAIRGPLLDNLRSE